MSLETCFPLWNQLNSQEQKILSQAAVYKEVSAGTHLFDSSTDCLGLVVVENGQLRAFITSESGKEITIYRLLSNDICLFSASCVMRNIQFDIELEARQDTCLWIIPSRVYKELSDRSLAIANYTNELMASRFTDVMWLMEQVMWNSMDQRLAGFLLEESNLRGDKVLTLTHEEIANHLGTAREVITRMLKHFASEGLVALSRGVVEITDENKLMKLSSI